MSSWQKFERLVGEHPKVVLAGDSVLDNFYWLQNTRRNLRVVVEEMLKETEGAEDLICLNMAVDQMSSFDFLLRRPEDNGWHQYQYQREHTHRGHPGDDALDRDGYRHLINAEGNIESAKNIARLKNVKYIFLSVGGNDVYLNADIQIGLGKSLVPGCDQRHKIADEYEARLSRIVKELKTKVPEARIVPVIVYHPHHGFPISGVRGGCVGGLAGYVQKNYLGWMVTPMVQRVLKLAHAESLDVIDLSQTFNPNDVRHYGNMDESLPLWSGAEPSDVSQNFIARLIAHVASEPPNATPHIYHAKTSGDDIDTLHSQPITPDVIQTYKFHKGPKTASPPDESKKSKTRKTKCCKA